MKERSIIFAEKMNTGEKNSMNSKCSRLMIPQLLETKREIFCLQN